MVFGTNSEPLNSIEHTLTTDDEPCYSKVLKEINTSIQHVSIKLIKSESKDMYNV